MQTFALDHLAEPTDPHALDGRLGEESRDRVVRHAVYTLPRSVERCYFFSIFTRWMLLPLPAASVSAKEPSRQGYPVACCGVNSTDWWPRT